MDGLHRHLKQLIEQTKDFQVPGVCRDGIELSLVLNGDGCVRSCIDLFDSEKSRRISGKLMAAPHVTIIVDHLYPKESKYRVEASQLDGALNWGFAAGKPRAYIDEDLVRRPFFCSLAKLR